MNDVDRLVFKQLLIVRVYGCVGRAIVTGGLSRALLDEIAECDHFHSVELLQ